MKLEINLDFEAAIAAALSPEKLGPILDKHIVAAVSSAVQDVTGYRSPFAEALKAQMAAALPHGLSIDDVAKFQHVLNQTITSLAQGMNAEAVNAALRKAAASTMPDVPSVMKLSEFLEEARDGFHKEKHDAFYALWEPSDYGGGGHLYLDSDADFGESSRYGSTKSKYSAERQLAVNEAGEVYTLKLDGRAVTPASRPDVITRFDSILMCMYVGRTRLELDIDADEVEAAATAQYD